MGLLLDSEMDWSPSDRCSCCWLPEHVMSCRGSLLSSAVLSFLVLIAHVCEIVTLFHVISHPHHSILGNLEAMCVSSVYHKAGPVSPGDPGMMSLLRNMCRQTPAAW